MIILGHCSAVEMPSEQGREQLTFPDSFAKTLAHLYNPRHLPVTLATAHMSTFIQDDIRMCSIIAGHADSH